MTIFYIPKITRDLNFKTTLLTIYKQHIFMFIEGKAVVNGENILNILKRLHHENKEINHEKHGLNQGHLFSFSAFY